MKKIIFVLFCLVTFGFGVANTHAASNTYCAKGFAPQQDGTYTLNQASSTPDYQLYINAAVPNYFIERKDFTEFFDQLPTYNGGVYEAAYRSFTGTTGQYFIREPGNFTTAVKGTVVSGTCEDQTATSAVAGETKNNKASTAGAAFSGSNAGTAKIGAVIAGILVFCGIALLAIKLSKKKVATKTQEVENS